MPVSAYPVWGFIGSSWNSSVVSSFFLQVAAGDCGVRRFDAASQKFLGAFVPAGFGKAVGCPSDSAATALQEKHRTYKHKLEATPAWREREEHRCCVGARGYQDDAELPGGAGRCCQAGGNEAVHGDPTMMIVSVWRIWWRRACGRPNTGSPHASGLIAQPAMRPQLPLVPRGGFEPPCPIKSTRPST